MNQLSCAQMREAISAFMDSEDAGIDTELLTNHLEQCRDCQQWQLRAQRLTRSARLSGVEVPDLTANVLAAVAADPVVVRRTESLRGRRQVLRIALAVSAVLQIVLAVPFLISSAGSSQVGMGESSARLGWEMAAFQVALAVAYLGVAWRPAQAGALMPAAVVLAACLLFLGVRDVVSQPEALAHNIGHLLAVVQAALLWGMARLGAPASRVERSGEAMSARLRAVA